MVQATNDREAIKQELLAQADTLFASFDTMETVLEDASKNYLAKQHIGDDNTAVTLVKYRADGLTEEMWQ